MVKAVIKRGAPGFTPAELQFQAEKAEADFKSNCNEEIANLKKRIEEIHLILSNHYNHHCELKMQSDASLEKSSDALLKIIADVKDHLSAVHTVVSKQTEMLVLYDRARKVNDTKVNLVECNQIDLKAFADSCNARIDVESDNASQSLKSHVVVLTDKIDTLSKQVASKPLEAPALRKEMDEKIALVAISNGSHVLRQTATEKRIHFLEKQLEYVLHVLKEKNL